MAQPAANCKSLALAWKGCAQNTGHRIWYRGKAETLLRKSFLASLFPSLLMSLITSFLLYFFAYFVSSRCSASRFKLILFSLFPILVWLPKYKIKEYILPDVLGGVSAGTIQVPQGEKQQLSLSLRGDSTENAQSVGVTSVTAGTCKPKLSLLFGCPCMFLWNPSPSSSAWKASPTLAI